jgi:hypothetical protein
LYFYGFAAALSTEPVSIAQNADNWKQTGKRDEAESVHNRAAAGNIRCQPQTKGCNQWNGDRRCRHPTGIISQWNNHPGCEYSLNDHHYISGHNVKIQRCPGDNSKSTNVIPMATPMATAIRSPQDEIALREASCALWPQRSGKALLLWWKNLSKRQKDRPTRKLSRSRCRRSWAPSTS